MLIIKRYAGLVGQAPASSSAALMPDGAGLA
jgi:hypothetical protein